MAIPFEDLTPEQQDQWMDRMTKFWRGLPVEKRIEFIEHQQMIKE